MKLKLSLLLMCVSSVVFSSEIIDGQNFSMEKIRESSVAISAFDANEIPGFTNNPKNWIDGNVSSSGMPCICFTLS